MKNPYRSKEEHDAARRAKVHKNENAVIAAAMKLNPNDKSARSDHLRETANLIIADRAAKN